MAGSLYTAYQAIVGTGSVSAPVPTIVGINFAGQASSITIKTNTAAALEITNGTTTILGVDSRNTVAGTAAITITPSPVTFATAASALVSTALKVPARTLTLTGVLTVTSLFGVGGYFDAPTLTDASAGTVSKASNLHVEPLAAAGGSLTLTSAYMISTGVSDCFLTNAGVWTDTACFARGKEMIVDAGVNLVASILEKLKPRKWVYALGSHGDDMGRERVGIVYDELPPELRAPGEANAVSPGLLSSFALAALRYLFDENKELKARLARLGV